MFLRPARFHWLACSMPVWSLPNSAGNIVLKSFLVSLVEWRTAVWQWEKLNIRSAAWMNGIVVNNTFVSVSPLNTPAKRVIISNIPLFISDDVLLRELLRHGKIVSPSGSCRRAVNLRC